MALDARKLIVVVVGAAAAAGMGWVAWSALNPDPCKQVADGMCELAGPEGCANVRIAFDKGRAHLTKEKCRQARDAFEGNRQLPLSMRYVLTRELFSDLFGTRKLNQMFHDASMAIVELDYDVRKKRSTDANLRKLRAYGPSVCLVVIAKLRDDQIYPATRPLLRQVLTGFAGQDLGTEPDDWQAWCNDVARGDKQLQPAPP